MNLYRRARRHAQIMLANVMLGALAIIIVDRAFGHSTLAFGAVIVLLIVLNRRILTYNCPRCGSNLFFRGWLVLPWPNRHCSQCGLDLDPPEG